MICENNYYCCRNEASSACIIASELRVLILPIYRTRSSFLVSIRFGSIWRHFNTSNQLSNMDQLLVWKLIFTSARPNVICRGLILAILIIRLITRLRIQCLINMKSVLQQMHNFILFEFEALSLQEYIWNILNIFHFL
jgi:hypothetical protein